MSAADLQARAREIAAGLDADEVEGFKRCIISDQFHALRRETRESPIYRWAFGQPVSSSVSLAVLDKLKTLGVIEWNNGHRATPDLGRAVAAVLASEVPSGT
jgi:hypothetical protein